MAFPTTSVLDDFNRANGSLGANWTIFAGSLSISSNQVIAGSAGTDVGFWNPATYGPDAECYLSIVAVPATNRQFNVYARMSAVSGPLDGYSVAAEKVGGTDNWFLIRLDDTVGTQLGTTRTAEFANGDKMGIECVGSTIRAWHHNGTSWAEIGSETDATYSAAGYLGFAIEQTTGTIDDFAGGTRAASAAELNGSATLSIVAAAVLLTAITLAGAGTATATTGAQLTTAIPLTGAATAVMTAAADLTTQIPLAGAASAVVTGSATFASDVELAGAATATVTATGGLTTAIPLAAAPALTVQATAALTTSIALAGQADALVVTTGDLATAIALTGTAAGAATAGGDLTTAIPLSGAAALSCVATCSSGAPPYTSAAAGRVTTPPTRTRTSTLSTRGRTVTPAARSRVSTPGIDRLGRRDG